MPLMGCGQSGRVELTIGIGIVADLLNASPAGIFHRPAYTCFSDPIDLAVPSEGHARYAGGLLLFNGEIGAGLPDRIQGDSLMDAASAGKISLSQKLAVFQINRAAANMKGNFAPSVFSAFRNYAFSLLWVGQLINSLGSALTVPVASILVYRVTGAHGQRHPEEEGEFPIIPAKVLCELAAKYAGLEQMFFKTMAERLSQIELQPGSAFNQRLVRELRTDAPLSEQELGLG